MAKRRRLGPAVMAGPEENQRENQSLTGNSGSVASPPIAQVAGIAASQAAARELADALTSARAEGRLVQDLLLSDIDETYLTRDRIFADAGDLAALVASIRDRGQQMPIEVVDKRGDATGAGDGEGPRYGLISGWRRVAALRQLAEEAAGGPDGAEFGTVRAVLRRPDGAADAYLSMVEENELRVGLSYYERAQIAARATDLGVFDSSAVAVQSLFPTASKAKRSKINSFIRVFRVLDPVLQFPEAIPERLGLRLAKALDAGQGRTLFAALREGGPFADPKAEQGRVERVLTSKTGSNVRPRAEKQTYAGGISLSRTATGLSLSGAGVDADLERDLAGWLEARQGALD